MFGIGIPELIVILALALIVLGPEKLPKVAKQIAKFAGELKRASEEFKKDFDVDSVTDIKLLEDLEGTPPGKTPEPDAGAAGPPGETVDYSHLDQQKRPPGGVGGDWHVAPGRQQPEDHSPEPAKPEGEEPEQIPDPK